MFQRLHGLRIYKASLLMYLLNVIACSTACGRLLHIVRLLVMSLSLLAEIRSFFPLPSSLLPKGKLLTLSSKRSGIS